MMIPFIKRKKAVQTYLTLLLNHERTVINHIILESWFNFTSQTQAWLLPDLLNQEIT